MNFISYMYSYETFYSPFYNLYVILVHNLFIIIYSKVTVFYMGRSKGTVVDCSSIHLPHCVQWVASYRIVVA